MPKPTLADLERELNGLVECAVAEEWQKAMVDCTCGAEKRYNASMGSRARKFKNRHRKDIIKLFQKISKKEND